MKATEFIELAHKGYNEPGKLLADFPGLDATSPHALAGLIHRYVENYRASPSLPNPLDRSALKDKVISFHHKAGTLTEGVQRNLELLLNHAPIIRFAHQANTLAYLGVTSQFIFLDLTAQSLASKYGMSACQLYFVVDHDAAEDRRFRVNHFPDVEARNGSLPFSDPVSKQMYDKPQWAVGKPSVETITHWVTSLETRVKHHLTILRRGGILEKEPGQLFERVRIIEQELFEAHDRSSNLSEFNAIFLSRLVNLHCRIPTVFLSLSQVTPLMAEYYEYLLKRYPEIVERSLDAMSLLSSNNISAHKNLRLRYDDFPAWYICQKCLTRVPCKPVTGTGLRVVGICDACGSRYQFELGSYSNPNLESIIQAIAPKVIFDDLLDILGFGISGGVSYVAGIEHALASRAIASRLGWGVPPECFWRPRGIYYGLAECRAAQILEGNQRITGRIEDALRLVFFGKASTVYHVISQGFDGLLQMWQRHFEDGGHVYEVSVGQSPFNISERARLLLESKMRLFDPISSRVH